MPLFNFNKYWTTWSDCKQLFQFDRPIFWIYTFLREKKRSPGDQQTHITLDAYTREKTHVIICRLAMSQKREAGVPTQPFTKCYQRHKRERRMASFLGMWGRINKLLVTIVKGGIMLCLLNFRILLENLWNELYSPRASVEILILHLAIFPHAYWSGRPERGPETT